MPATARTREPQEGLRRHKLFPAEARRNMPPLYSQDGKGQDAIVHLKLFCPYGRGTWFLTEGEENEDGGFTFFGYCVSQLGPDCDEFGYVTFDEIANTKVKLFGRVEVPAIERDMHYSGIGKTVRECLEDQ